MTRQILAATLLGVMVAVGLAACEDKGPMQKAGEKLDRAGKNVDDAVKDLKK